MYFNIVVIIVMKAVQKAFHFILSNKLYLLLLKHNKIILFNSILLYLFYIMLYILKIITL